MLPPAVAPPAVVAPPGAWHAWTLDPSAAAIAGAAILYAVGLRRLRGRSRPTVTARQGASFAAGLAVLAAALVSPLDAAARTLLSAHMVQHLLLIVAAPPLLVFGRRGLVLRLGLPGQVRAEIARLRRGHLLRRVWRAGRNPLVVVAANAVALWAWHLPAAYELALGNPAWHAAEHLTFLASSLALWALVIDPAARRRGGRAGAMLAVFAIMLQSAALGAVITFSRVPLYPTYAATAGLWHVSPLADQQLAGAMMWIPPGALYLGTIVVLARRWLDDVDRAVRRREAIAAGEPT